MDDRWKLDLERWLTAFLGALRRKARAQMRPAYVAGLSRCRVCTVRPGVSVELQGRASTFVSTQEALAFEASHIP